MHRTDEESVGHVGREAVVIGGSIAGLTGAAALSGSFDRVTIVERDPLPDGPEQRRGVPQGHHIHAIQLIGLDALNTLFPGFREDLIAAGSVESDLARDTVWWTGTCWRPRVASTVRMLNQTRPLLESVVRRRALAMANVRVVEAAARGLVATEDGARVTGVKIFDGDGARTLHADFVLDASGRGSSSLKWLAELGYEKPPEIEVSGFLTYTSQFLDVPAGVVPEGVDMVIIPCFPGNNLGAALLHQEGDRWLLSTQGMIHEAAPTDQDGFHDFLRRCTSPYLYEIALQSRPVSEIKSYRAPRNVRRLFERLDRRPRGFGLIGDAVAHFNPVYGQGMSVASMSAAKVRELLDAGTPLDALPEAIQTAITPTIDWAFGVAATSDALYPGAEVDPAFELPPADQLEHLGNVDRMASEDPDVLVKLLDAYYFQRVETLFEPAFKELVDQWVASEPPATDTDPLSPPAVREPSVT